MSTIAKIKAWRDSTTIRLALALAAYDTARRYGRSRPVAAWLYARALTTGKG